MAIVLLFVRLAIDPRRSITRERELAVEVPPSRWPTEDQQRVVAHSARDQPLSLLTTDVLPPAREAMAAKDRSLPSGNGRHGWRTSSQLGSG